MKPFIISSGEPAGIGPDLCLSLAEHALPVVIAGDESVLQARAELLGLSSICFHNYLEEPFVKPEQGHLWILPVPCPYPVLPGVLNPQNAAYVLALLSTVAERTQTKEFSAIITAPVHKENINAAGFAFTGHTEFFADFFKVPQVVMMLACEALRVALLTTHVPLSKVPGLLTFDLIQSVARIVHHACQSQLGIAKPRLKIAGLNPHAGEGGYLGTEEQEIMIPALQALKKEGIDLKGPYSADTLFITEKDSTDVFIAVYHDQGLPVLKYAGFHQAVNITLGLPVLRVSVDHGTALALAGSGKADAGSLLYAINTALHCISSQLLAQ